MDWHNAGACVSLGCPAGFGMGADKKARDIVNTLEVFFAQDVNLTQSHTAISCNQCDQSEGLFWHGRAMP